MPEQETISRIVKKENWNVLSHTQQSMLKRMGFKPGTPTKPKAPPSRKQKAYATLKEYYIIAHVKCTLCGHLAEEAYHMKKMNYEGRGEPYLQAVSCPIEEAREGKFKRELHSRPYCVVCKTKLLEKDKEGLVLMVLKKARECACNWR